MGPIDWRDLYAANRAVIEGRTRSGGDPQAGPVPGQRAANASASAGAWERLADPDGKRNRACFVYTPPGLTAATAAPMIVMLHGCTQTAPTLSASTLMSQAADRHGFVVVYPQQDRAANERACWNWFLAPHQTRGTGEPEFIAATARAVMETTSRWTIDARRVFVAGLSAGGAMAAVMAATYPDIFAALAVHSGLAYRCATSLGAANAALARGGPDAQQLGRDALAAMGPFARPIPTIVVHGTADRTVHPINGDQVVEQWMVTNRLASAGYHADFHQPLATSHRRVDGGLAYTRHRWQDDAGNLLQEYLKVDGLGHAWSGGAAGGSYTDPRGPSATEAIWEFVAEATRAR
jgi:poly(hydroxyalkanoate) depolymerase family esterase